MYAAGVVGCGFAPHSKALNGTSGYLVANPHTMFHTICIFRMGSRSLQPMEIANNSRVVQV